MILSKAFLTVPWLRRSVSGFSPWRPGFNPKSFHVRLVVDKVTLGQFFLRVLRFSPVSTITLMFHIHSLVSH
jgi:hypothetical protein